MNTIIIDDGARVAITADLHYGHRNIIQYCQRPWLSKDDLARVRAGEKIRVDDATLKAHNAGLIAGIRSVVRHEKDVLFILGDVAWGAENLGELYSQLPTLRVYCLVGNHDDAAELVEVFGSHSVFERVMLNIGGQKAVLDHFAGDSWEGQHKGVWQLYGHSHGTIESRRAQNPAWSLSLDVGCDHHGYRPWLWKEELVPHFAGKAAAWQAWRDKTYAAERGLIPGT